MPPTQPTATVAAPAPAPSAGGEVNPFGAAELPGQGDPAYSGAETPQTAVADKPADEQGEGEQANDQPEVAPETPETPAADPAKPAVPEKLYAGQYKTPEELEIAFGHSSREGKRLAAYTKELEAASAKTQGELSARIAELEILAEVGPEMKEPTDEELEAMGPVKAMRLTQKMSDRKTRLAQLKAQREQSEKTSKAEAQAKETRIVNLAKNMRSMKDEAGNSRYPDFDEVAPIIDELIDFEPGAFGHEKSPIIGYYAAYGFRALQKDRAAKTKTKESEEAAKAKARAAAAGAGAAGATGTGKDPAVTKTGPEPDSDAEANDRLTKAYARKHVSLI